MIRVIVVLVLIFYIWTATGGTNSFNSNQNSYYNLLTDAFLSGHLYLPVEPRTELLALPNPYDPNTGHGLRLHDASLYHGKYYLYYGPISVLTLYIPYRLLTSNRMPDNLVGLIFSFGAFLFSLGLLSRIINRYFKDIQKSHFALALLLIAFANAVPYNLRRTEMYEVAISSGLFFLMGGIYFLYTAIQKSKENPFIWVFLGSLFLAMSIAGRPHLGCALLILPFIIKEILKENPGVKNKIYLAAIIPSLICILLVMLYNYLRFKDPFQFGLNYILTTEINTKVDRFFKLDNILPNLYFYFFQSPIFNLNFPYIHINASIPSFIKLPQVYFFEKMVGIFPSNPFSLILFLLPVIYKMVNKLTFKDLIGRKGFFCLIEFQIIVIPLVCILAVLLLETSVTWRYFTDFSTLLIMLTILIWFYIDSKMKNNNTLKMWLTIFIYLLAIYTIVTGISLSLIGCWDGLISQNPTQFHYLKNVFDSILNFILRRSAYF